MSENFCQAHCWIFFQSFEKYGLVPEIPAIHTGNPLDFVPPDILKNVATEDIEDLPERFLLPDQEKRDADTVKRINLKDYPPFFVIAIVEHESKVNFRMAGKLLLYSCFAVARYETKEEG